MQKHITSIALRKHKNIVCYLHSIYLNLIKKMIFERNKILIAFIMGNDKWCAYERTYILILILNEYLVCNYAVFM